jgi:predicted alpha-1,2-mannosidase
MGTAEHYVAGAPDNFACYFLMEVDCAFDFMKSEDGITYLKFSKLPKTRTVDFRIGTSFISEKQTEINLGREIGCESFDTVINNGKKTWNEALAGIKIEDASEEQLRTFYSAFYRTKLFPRIFYEFNEYNEMIHYSPYNGKIEEGTLYTDNGFWDTYRTVYPLFSIISPDFDADIIQGWINSYKESGWFPKWASPGHRECMIGTSMVNIITDALYKNIDSFDVEKAYEGCLKDSLDPSGGFGWGRRELESYMELGYCAMEVVKESTSRTLEYAYNDFCMAQFAKRMGKKDDYNKFIARSKYYKNVFDYSDKFMKGKYLDGTWEKDFDPITWGGGQMIHLGVLIQKVTRGSILLLYLLMCQV